MKTEEMRDEVENEFDGLRDSFLRHELSQPYEMDISRQPVQNKKEQQHKNMEQKYEETKQFRQSKVQINDIMKILQITTDITTIEDEKKLITNKIEISSIKKEIILKQYDAIPKLEYVKKQSEVPIHQIGGQYPKIEFDSKINYEWSLKQDQKIGLKQGDDDVQNPRFSFLQMDQKSELEIQKYINQFLAFDDFSFVMIKQNL